MTPKYHIFIKYTFKNIAYITYLYSTYYILNRLLYQMYITLPIMRFTYHPPLGIENPPLN
jgi:hypothetical protein